MPKALSLPPRPPYAKCHSLTPEYVTEHFSALAYFLLSAVRVHTSAYRILFLERNYKPALHEGATVPNFPLFSGSVLSISVYMFACISSAPL